MSVQRRFKTFVTEQKTLLFFQIMILLGLLIQVIMFFAFIWYGRPPAWDYEAISQFFLVAALWIITINISVVLFWWVSRLGKWPFLESMNSEEESEMV
ncbi:hypothetical protein EU537_10275 [Candidatus Thorarchaeota archaeon]|nr:MAG: hypothetical protein EU537_10275 [Candidatus Thorarchaeota archaeon]